MKIFLIALLAASLMVFSCKKKDKDKEENKPSTVTPSESKDILKTSGTQLKGDIVSFTQSEGADAISSLSRLLASTDSDPLSGVLRKGERKNQIKAAYKERVTNFKNLFLPEGLPNGRITESFDYNSNKGVYNWNNATESFEKSGPSDKIVMNFPSVENGVNNDAKLTLHSYTENADLSPTQIKADLYVNAVKYVDLDFSATYSGDTPSKLYYAIYLKPFTNSLNYSDGGNLLKIATSVYKDGEAAAVVSTDFVIDFADSQKEEVTKINGGVYYREIGIKGSVDAKSLDAIEEELTVAQINQFVKLQIVRSGNNNVIGDVEIIEDASTEFNAIVKFSDGSSELLETYFKDAIDGLEDYLMEVSNSEE
jgi:hypothetical protein